MAAEMRTEISNLWERGTFTILLKEEIPENSNIFQWWFVLVLKSTVDGDAKFKSSFVNGGHREEMKINYVTFFYDDATPKHKIYT